MDETEDGPGSSILALTTLLNSARRVDSNPDLDPTGSKTFDQ